MISSAQHSVDEWLYLSVEVGETMCQPLSKALYLPYPKSEGKLF